MSILAAAPDRALDHRAAHPAAPRTLEQPHVGRTLAERSSTLPVILMLAIMRGSSSIDRVSGDASARLAAARDRRRSDALHWAFAVAIVVLLAIAVSLTTAAIIMCARQGGVLEFIVRLDPFFVKVGCKKI